MHQLLMVLGKFQGVHEGRCFSYMHICMNLATSTETLHSSALSYVTLKNLSVVLAYNYSIRVAYMPFTR